ncbi:hypothetical protein D3C76_1077810 [compost metagenome]
MTCKSPLSDRQSQGSWIFRLLLRIRRVFAWLAPVLMLALGVGGAACAFLAWEQANLLFGAIALLAFGCALLIAVLWSEYDWWLFKLGPRDGLDMPIE